MHIPDGFIAAGPSLASGVMALGGLGAVSRKASGDGRDELVPLAGLVAAFVFAAQMVNFPVAAGTSGHLIGGALAAILVGPWMGSVCLAVVVLVQALFADGGLTAIGLNTINLAGLGCLGGYLLFAGARSLVPATRTGVLIATAIASAGSVVLAAAGFAIEYAIGGTVDIPLATLVSAMVGVHLLIGIGEAVITTMTIGAVLKIRPDLIYGARDLPRPARRTDPHAAHIPA